MACKHVGDRKFTRRESDDYLGYKYGTLEKRHFKGLDPPCHKAGGRYFYFQSDLDAFDKHRQTF
jgi:hypothetical protein